MYVGTTRAREHLVVIGSTTQVSPSLPTS
jgi:ATP-dependent exoDNAse (exonuclease V) beta subunit